MKKNIKKYLALIMVGIFILSNSTVAFAEPTPQTITFVDSSTGTTYTVKENEKVRIPLIFVDDYKPTTRGITPGEAGYIEAWGSGHYYYWTIILNVPCTGFTGYVSCTDITSGLSAGSHIGVTGLLGSVYCARITGHTYSASITGYAYNGPDLIARTNSNTTLWTA